MGEYSIDNVLFNSLSLHDLGHLGESPFTIITIIPLVPSQNQTYFIYVGSDGPTYQYYKLAPNFFLW